MIEIERKFQFDDIFEEKLRLQAKFIGEIVFTDTYFDYVDFRLTTNNKWLRKRNSTYELKLPIKSQIKSSVTQYHEYDKEKEIIKQLHLKESKDFESTLVKNGIKSFATVTTTRRQYKYGEFLIVLDSIDYGYQLGEVELMIDEESEAGEAISKIEMFAQEFNIDFMPPRGKLIEYIFRYLPNHPGIGTIWT